MGSRSRCQRRVDFAVFKVLDGEGVYMSPFRLLSFQCVLQSSTSNIRSKEKDDCFDLQCTLIFEVILCHDVLYKLLFFLKYI
jgi:hypothetical protein